MYTLYVGNKNVLVVVAARLARDEAFGRAVQRSRRCAWSDAAPIPPSASFSPSGLVPCLHDGDVVGMGYARDRRVPRGAAPGHVARRRASPGRVARSIAAEMHSGFGALRSEMSMCIRERVDVRPWSRGAHRRHRAHRRRCGPTRARASAPAATSCAAHSRSRTASTRPSCSASRRTASTWPALRATTPPRCSRHPFLREWEAAALARDRDRSRRTSRASSIATSSRAAAA